jgi:hypothetical protein
MPRHRAARDRQRAFGGLRPSQPSVETWTSGEWVCEYPDTTLLRLAGKSIYILHDLKRCKPILAPAST